MGFGEWAWLGVRVEAWAVGVCGAWGLFEVVRVVGVWAVVWRLGVGELGEFGAKRRSFFLAFCLLSRKKAGGVQLVLLKQPAFGFQGTIWLLQGRSTLVQVLVAGDNPSTSLRRKKSQTFSG